MTVGPRQGTRYSRYLRYFWCLVRDQGGLVTVGPHQGTRYSRYLRYFWVLGRILLNSNSCSF